MAPNADETVSPNANLQIPKWINEEYFYDILVKEMPDFSKVISFNAIAATAPGDNYTSIMVRISMDVELKDSSAKKVSYILKTALEGSKEGADFVTSMCLFPKEKHVYQVLIPQFENLYKEAGVELHFGPKCMHVEQTPELITLVMEDLRQRGFANCDRLKGLDFAHMTRVLEKLAEWHAVSAVYYQLNGPYEEMFHNTFFSEETRPMMVAMADHRMGIFMEAMQGWGLEGMEQFAVADQPIDLVIDEMIRMNAVDPNEFNVLNHGDLWVNNIMFNHKKNGDIDETLLVDFQVGKWGTPAQDLWYFITTSAHLDIKVKEFDRFIAIYHARLVECLKLLKYTRPIPTLKDLHITMLKYGYWGMMTATGALCAVLLPPDENSTMDNFLTTTAESDRLMYKTYTNPYYSNAMRQMLPFLYGRGLLNELGM